MSKALDTRATGRDGVSSGPLDAARERLESPAKWIGPMQHVWEIVKEIADSDATVLIRGESGVGKEVVARTIVQSSSRPDQTFVKINCAALPSELLESELFGHEKGAFTGAFRRKLGRFEFAREGTLYLDEIGDLPHGLQAKLLHVLQDREFCRVGGREVIRVDTRIIAATNRDLERAVADGSFREDLYYRLNVVEIRVPPLRERTEEIPELVRGFIEKFSAQLKRQFHPTPELLGLLQEYPWPGNVRELENIIRRLVVLCRVDGVREQTISLLRARSLLETPADRPRNGGLPAPAAPVAPPAPPVPPATAPEPRADRTPLQGLRAIARQAAAEAERKALRQVLDQVRWNRTKAAELLKVSYKTLLLKISDYGLK